MPTPHVRTIKAAILVAIFGFSTLFGTLALTSAANAQLAVGVLADAPRTVDTVLSKVLQGLKVGVLNVVSGAVSYALQKIAYDSAVWIASGGKGQAPLVYTKGFSGYLSDVANDAVGHGIDQLTAATGYNLCKISDPNIDLKFRQALRLGIGITAPRAPGKPSCTLTEFAQNNLSGDAWRSRYDRVSKSIQNQFNEALTFDVSQSDLGIQLTALDALSAAMASAKENATKDRQEGDGIKSLDTPISGDKKVPAKSIGAELEGLTSKERTQQSVAQINTAIGTGEFQLLPGALSTFFLNTLAGTMLKNFREKGILPFGACVGGLGGEVCQSGSGTATSFEALTQVGGRRAAEALFSDFITARPAAVDQFNILGELSNCPDTPGTYNCRLDTGFAQALQEASNGTPLTIQDAITRGFLRGDWKLLPPSRIAENANKTCAQNAFCNSNVKALRQLRVVPLGFEVATELSDPDKPWTLNEVVAGFNDCNYNRDASGNVVGVTYDPVNKPFCHLIDPTWVLKAPITRCNALGYGSTLLNPDVPDRKEECADLATCVAYNKDGACVNYGYCTRERNTWKFDADKCDAQFRTCQTFTDSAGAQKSYVYRSLNTAFCAQNTVGCRAYSLTQDANGNWLNPNGPTSYGTQTGIFFNGTVSNSCSAGSAGCSAFRVAANADVSLYLRKAPSYLGCYDANPATPQTEWPSTAADLTRVRPQAACAQYAQACIADEVGCTYYSPATGDTSKKIPARFSSRDVCNAACVGYDAYREMPSSYTTGQDVAYIVPSSGQMCQPEAQGCTGFTNLGTTAAGLEKVDYFSYLRPCSLPDAQKQKNFSTYESTVSGFQLKTFTLISDQTGAPAYFYRTIDERAQFEATCNQATYKAGIASLDCREFNDEAGNVYYRLLSKTIPVSESCTPYRLSETALYPTALSETECTARKGSFANGQCNLCLMGGEFRNGSCFYFGLPGGVPSTAGESITCSQADNSCRAYKGNAGNNIRNIFVDTFENQGTATQWLGTGISTSPESVRTGGKSLTSLGTEIVRPFTMTPGQSYEIEFWAKGAPQSVEVSLQSFDGSVVRSFGSVSVGDTWRSFRLGSIEAPGSATNSARIVFKLASTAAFFVDNITLRETTEMVYVLKDTLRVDPVCDSNQTDNLPGEGLGCRAYRDTAGNTLNLTGFSYLCREGAIGCTALLDTQNSSPQSPGPHIYNLFVTGQGGTEATVTVAGQSARCQIPVGENGCYVTISGPTLDEVRQAAPATIVSSTVYVPATTIAAQPVYLVANQAATCNAVDLGCTYAGLQTPSPAGATYSTVLIKNDPSAYAQNLCQAQAVGCQAYNSATGPTYFKDPALTGNKVCSYRTGVLVNGIKTSGWFWKDVGVCSNDRTKACTQSTDCSSGATCTDIGNRPCYPSYQVDGTTYGLWSFGDRANYQDFVGECPVQQNGCSEFIDRADNNRAYYLIKNERLGPGTCDGKVSQKEGCALFDDTSNPNKFYVSRDTYAQSNSQQSRLVEPVLSSNSLPGDTNVIFKVTRDRECGEWLQCRSSHRVWDEKNARWKTVCDAVGRCNRAPETPEEDNISNCASWVEEDLAAPAAPLTPSQYVARDTSWTGQEFSGYSLLNQYPVEYLSQVNISRSESAPDWRLVRQIPCGDTNCAAGVSPNDTLCASSGTACGLRGVGICLNGFCVQNLDGTAKDIAKNAPTQICRAYPEKDSPFPRTPFIDRARRQFAAATLCDEIGSPSSDPKKVQACECDYTKIKYGDIYTKYFSYAKPHTTEEVIKGSPGVEPQGICLGGTQDGKACRTDNECFKTKANSSEPATDPYGNVITDGTCQKSKFTYKLLGWRGFCLEPDLSRTINGDPNSHPCLTWYPVDYLTGTQDINNQYVEAGYQPPGKTGGLGGIFYCAVGNAGGGAEYAASFQYPQSHKLVVRPRDTNPLVSDTADRSQGGNDQFVRNRRSATPEEAAFSRQDIERIDFELVSGDKEDPRGGAKFSIWPNDDKTPAGQPQSFYKTKNEKRGPGVAVTGRYLGKEREWVMMYGSAVTDNAQDGTYVDKLGNVCYPHADYGDVVGSWNSNSGQCQDLNGNIFQGLNSRKGGLEVEDRFTCSSNCRLKDGQGFSAQDGSALTMSSEGIWDYNFTADQICRSYGPRYSSTDWQGNWHALRVRFNAQDKFAGYDMAYCDQSPDGGSVKYEVTFILKQWCSVIADVGSTPTLPETDPAAWTNRLWANNPRGYSVAVAASVGMVAGVDAATVTMVNLGYTYGTDVKPFGSLGMNNFGNVKNTVNLSAFNPIMTSCSNSGIESCERSKGLVPDGGKTPEFQESVAGAPYSCPDGTCIRSLDDANKTEERSNASLLTREMGAQLFSMLFARPRAIYQFGNGSYLRVENAPSNIFTRDYTENINVSATGVPKPPIVLPVGACDSSGHCVEGLGGTGISVNDRDGGDVRIFTPTARVFVRFFAFADANQMPLRQLSVNWGDGRVYPLKGLFRNFRGYRPATCNTQLRQCEMEVMDDLSSCSTDGECGGRGRCVVQAPGSSVGKCVVKRTAGACASDEECDQTSMCTDVANSPQTFGTIAGQTCDSNYAQFEHVYQCTRTPVSQGGNFEPDPAKCGDPRSFPTGCCIFVPKVQVKDNWGWCNGRCAGGVGGDGCYTKVGGLDECTSNPSAWTSYGGRIIVAPPTVRR